MAGAGFGDRLHHDRGFGDAEAAPPYSSGIAMPSQPASAKRARATRAETRRCGPFPASRRRRIGRRACGPRPGSAAAPGSMKNPLSNLTASDAAIVADLGARICFLESAACEVLLVCSAGGPPLAPQYWCAPSPRLQPNSGLPEFGHYLSGRSRIQPTSAERVGMRGISEKAVAWRIPLTRRLRRRPLPASGARWSSRLPRSLCGICR